MKIQEFVDHLLGLAAALNLHPYTLVDKLADYIPPTLKSDVCEEIHRRRNEIPWATV